MNGAYLAAGVLAFLGAAIHGGVGEALVVRRIEAEALPSTRFGGPQGTLRMIRASWHMVTIVFVASGTALSACAAHGHSRACAGVGMLAADSYAGLAAIAIASAGTRGPTTLIRHPAPLLLSAVASQRRGRAVMAGDTHVIGGAA